MKSLKPTILPVALLVLASCNKGHQDTTANAVAFQLKAINRSSALRLNTSAADQRVSSTSIDWAAGTGFVDLLKFEAKDSSGEIEFKNSPHQEVDLFAAIANLGSVTIPPGVYSEVEFRAEFRSNSNSPALELKGIFTNGSANIPVLFRVDSDVEIKSEMQNVTITAGSNTALTNLDLTQLTQGISNAALAAATINNGRIEINSSSNANLFKIMMDNLNSHHRETEFGHH
jgi:hypothetical protein